MHKKLFIPGPVEVNPDVLEKMATPLIGHRTKDATALQQGISEKMQKVMATKNTIVLSTSSGSGLMEGAVRCFTAKRAAVFSIGEKNYVGFEDWIDFDFNDVIFEVKGTEGGTPIDDVDEWEEIRVIAEDLSVGQETDFDFNDVVFDVRRYTLTTKKHTEGEVEIILRAAGGTLPLYVDGHEVHQEFNVDVNEMVNTNAQRRGLKGADRAPVTLPVPANHYSGTTIGEIANSIEVYVVKEGANCYLEAPVNGIASKIGVKCDFEWCDEREDIDNKYKLEGASDSLFKDWVQEILPSEGWYRYAKESIEEYKNALQQ